MKKTELVEHLATSADVSKTEAERVLDSFVDLVNSRAVDGDETVVPGLGKFVVAKRNARTARNPQTGQPIHVPEAYVPKFRPAARLKDSANT